MKKFKDSVLNFKCTESCGIGIYNATHDYPVPCHKQPVYFDPLISCPTAENLADVLLSLPMHPYLTETEVNYVCDCIKQFFRGEKWYIG
jgi:dTDP-4-amino-4,6-dideoxygalactose transaminase